MVETVSILTIDDHPLNQRLIGRMLSVQGYNTIMAFDGFSGIEMAREHRPHLILLDILLPDIGGFDVFRLLKLHQHTALIPVIAITAYIQRANRETCLKAGFSEYITKPIMRRELYTKIRSLIETGHNA